MIFIMISGVSRLLNARLDIMISNVAARQAAILARHPTPLAGSHSLWRIHADYKRR
jgi:hypothetical protein